MKHISFKLLLLSATLAASSCTTTKNTASSKKGTSTAQASAKAPEKTDIQPYDKVITKKAITDEGLFKVHKIDERYFYEIPDSLFEREMLVVTRIAKTASGLGFGGGKQNEQVLRWQKKDKKVLDRKSVV